MAIRRIRRWIPPRRANPLIFGVAVLFIAAVSVHDAALVVLNEQVIADTEQNPMGRWLIQRDGGRVWLFVAVKLLGTAIACAALVALYQSWRTAALAASASLAGFQLWLLLYLSLD